MRVLSCWKRGQWRGPENTQGKLRPSVEENKLSQKGGMAKGISYFYKSASSVAMVMVMFLEWW